MSINLSLQISPEDYYFKKKGRVKRLVPNINDGNRTKRNRERGEESNYS